MLLDVFPAGPVQANCTLLGDEEAGKLVIVDPGDEAERIVEKVKKSGLEPVAILHTHGHMDHAGGTAGVKAAFPDALVWLHREDLELYERLAQQARMFGLQVEDPPTPDRWLEHGQRIAVGSLELEVRHTPGHSPGSVCFVVHNGPAPLAIVGDVLFAGSIGRTDLWGGSFETLERSIVEQLYTLADETKVITGHGPATTIGHERRTNPFVREE